MITVDESILKVHVVKYSVSCGDRNDESYNLIVKLQYCREPKRWMIQAVVVRSVKYGN